VGSCDGKKPLERPRLRWEGNIKMDFQDVRRGVIDWIDLAEGRNRWQLLVNAVMNLQVPINARSFLTS
jgi:hypothetical protein